MQNNKHLETDKSGNNDKGSTNLVVEIQVSEIERRGEKIYRGHEQCHELCNGWREEA